MSCLALSQCLILNFYNTVMPDFINLFSLNTSVFVSVSIFMFPSANLMHDVFLFIVEPSKASV